VFHFNITDGRKLFDPRGLELPDAEAARQCAQQLARGFHMVVQPEGLETYVEVIDEIGTPLGRFVIKDGKDA
jgi:Domain of unknown function (DUF6894)